MLTCLGVFYNNMIRNKIYLIPNLLTTGSILCGFISIIYSFDGNLLIAANLLFASFILDGLDGRIARITKTTSDFGAQYDSLADVVSFGVAPAIFLYQWFLKDINFFINSCSKLLKKNGIMFVATLNKTLKILYICNSWSRICFKMASDRNS